MNDISSSESYSISFISNSLLVTNKHALAEQDILIDFKFIY